jgi:ATP-dependent Clp protease ATP-binding subunit ClpC
LFELFTDGARRVVAVAQDESRRLNHNYIGSEHVLLALIHEEGAAGQVLKTLGVSLEAARREVEEILGPGRTPPTLHIPFTPQVKKALERAFREARDLGDDYISTQHILLGVIREGEGFAAQILRRLGVRSDQVRQALKGELPEGGPRSDPAPEAEREPVMFRDTGTRFEEWERNALTLLLHEGLTATETAEVLGISDEALRTILHRVVQKLEGI